MRVLGVKKRYRSEYCIWDHIKGRCSNKNHHAYRRYGGRGITVCKRWKESFLSFLEDVGNRPQGMSLDRLDNDGGYWCGKCDECRYYNRPANCEWRTNTQQQNNTRATIRVTVGDQTKTLREWSDATGIPIGLLRRRVRSNRLNNFLKPYHPKVWKYSVHTQTRRLWRAIIERCCNPNCESYPAYGGRGITIYEGWRESFESFVAAVGYRPSPNLSLDRIDGNKGYVPGNVRWATAKEQRANQTRIGYKRRESQLVIAS